MSPRRVAVVASEILGMRGAGGAGTADSLLAVALGRGGHRVELLIAPGRDAEVTADWARTYSSSGVTVRPLEDPPGVSPSFLRPTMAAFLALREQPADVVIADDWRALAYIPLRARQLGLAFQDTAFVVHCHGPARVLAEFAQKVPDTVARFGEEVAERASIGLADAVVSPSAWLLDWMREHRWPVPDSARVVQYVRQSAALGVVPPRAESGVPIRRLAFFGQIREGKGVRVFLAALDRMEPELLEGVEVLFLGKQTPRWAADRILSVLSPSLREGVAAIRLEPGLDRDGALEMLRQPGTLAVMPSLLDNSPNTVSECIEQGIPFVATSTGGIPELIAENERARVLCPPTADDLTAALRRALTSRPTFAPALPARDPREALDAWMELVGTILPARPREAPAPERVAVIALGKESARRAEGLAVSTRSVQVEVVQAGSRRAGLACTAAEWVVFLDDEDTPDDAVLDRLVAAQARTNADVVTPAVRPADDPEALQLFLGDPGALGIVENQYGVVGLVRRSLLPAEPPDGTSDPEWPLFAGLALAGARFVSTPEPLAVHAGRPGRAGDVPGEGLAVLAAFEARGAELHDLPQLAATLGAAHARLESSQVGGPAPTDGLLGRSFRILRTDGIGGFARAATGYALRAGADLKSVVLRLRSARPL